MWLYNEKVLEGHFLKNHHARNKQKTSTKSDEMAKIQNVQMPILIQIGSTHLWFSVKFFMVFMTYRCRPLYNMRMFK